VGGGGRLVLNGKGRGEAGTGETEKFYNGEGETPGTTFILEESSAADTFIFTKQGTWVK